MARRRKGRDVSGWLLVDKPEGVTSTQVVGKARWALDAKKAGHAGTLDPLASGLLAVAFGEATKTVPFAQDGLKTYRFTAKWGEATATDDREGDVIARSDARPTAAEIEAVLPRFIGEIMQTPPAFSAIKVDGERAYDLARRGDEFALKARPIEIRSLRLIAHRETDTDFEMVCGKGGYVRSMARDLGAALRTVAHVKTLRRTSSGAFDVCDALSLDAVEALRDDPARDLALRGVAAALSDMPACEIDEETALRLRHGDPGGTVAPAPIWLATHCDDPIAILRRGDAGEAKIIRVLSPLETSSQS